MSRVSYTSYDLGYPPWALDFDPYNRGYLLVGGGGGAGQKEVPNRLTLLDVSSREQAEKVAECDVSDDSPASLGVLASKDGLIAFLGANSSAADRNAGKNEHFRSFRVTFPHKSKGAKKSRGSIEQLGKNCLFSERYTSSNDAFQRLLRLSPARKSSAGAKRIGAIANSLIQPSEIVVFDATLASPSSKEVIHRIELPEKTEANDLDIWEVSEGEFLLAYCTSTEVFVSTINYDFSTRKVSSKVEPATSQHQTSVPRSKYRSVRFLSKDYLLVMANRSEYSELLVLKIYPKEGAGDVILRKSLANRMKAAVSMDVSLLDEDTTTGERQVIVALAAQREDIYLLTLDVPAKGSPKSFTTFSHFRRVHEAPMKKVVLSSFFSPYSASNSEKKESSKKPGPQFMQLASISLSNNIVVESLPLHSIKTKSTPRYVLRKSGSGGTGLNLFVLAFVLLISLILAQSVLDHQAPEGEVSHIQLLPPQVRTFINQARQDYDPVKNLIHEATEGHFPHSLHDLVHHHAKVSESTADRKAIIVAPPKSGSTDVSVEVHDDHAAVEEHPDAKRWDELTPKEQQTWKKRLADAGHWTSGQGETILKSIFFSEIAGAVGRAALG
jgi:prolactin regulatory element-binding protein